MPARLTAPLKWPGGKWYLAPKIVGLMPPHLHYVEPFFGGGSVLLARDPDDERLWVPPHKGVSEVMNDINGQLHVFWSVLQSPELFAEFRRRVEAIPMSRLEWSCAHDEPFPARTLVDSAVHFFVNCRQSRSGMMKDFTSITRTRTRRGMNGNVSEWLGAVDGLPEVHARLRRVLVENMDAIALIDREDTPNTLFYVDPPYVHGTRASKDLYAHEMADEHHERLVSALACLKGKAIVSGYRHRIYDVLHERCGYHLIEVDMPNHLAGGESKRRMTEALWLNYDPPTS